jgi:hypothetical protein
MLSCCHLISVGWFTTSLHTLVMMMQVCVLFSLYLLIPCKLEAHSNGLAVHVGGSLLLGFTVHSECGYVSSNR